MSRKIRKGRSGTTKADLVDAVYRRHGGMTKAEAAAAVDTILQTMKDTLQDGRSVRIRNFGAFEVTEREGRTAGIVKLSIGDQSFPIDQYLRKL